MVEDVVYAQFQETLRADLHLYLSGGDLPAATPGCVRAGKVGGMERMRRNNRAKIFLMNSKETGSFRLTGSGTRAQEGRRYEKPDSHALRRRA